MSNIFVVYTILSIDHVKKHNLIVSSAKDRIEFPIYKIEHPRSLHNEIRYNLQTMLLDKTYDKEIISKISFSYIDVQNELVLKYMENFYSDDERFDTNNDIFILVNIIIEKPYPLSQFEWRKFDFAKSITNMDLVTSIVDFTIQKSIL